MNYINRNGVIATKGTVENFYDLFRNEVYLGNIHKNLLTVEHGWNSCEDEYLWELNSLANTIKSVTKINQTTACMRFTSLAVAIDYYINTNTITIEDLFSIIRSTHKKGGNLIEIIKAHILKNLKITSEIIY